MKFYFTIALLLLILQSAAAQQYKTEFSIFLAGGRSYFLTNVEPSKTRYTTPEARAGILISGQYGTKLPLSCGQPLG